MKKQSNPFVFGKIVGENNFCNRKLELVDLQQNVNNGYSVWLFAPRRYGKTSLVKRVFKQTTHVKTIYFDLYNIESLDDFSRKYSDILSKELFDWKDEVKDVIKSIKKYFSNLSPKISFNEDGIPELSLNQQNINTQGDLSSILSLPEKVAKAQDINICIAFDEFQEIERIDKFIINWMRSEFQNQENVSYIFLGSKQSLMESIFTSINSPFYEYAIKMDINPIARPELYAYIENKFLESNLQIDAIIIDDILNKSACHPHFTQYFASVVYDIKIANNGIDNASLLEQWMNKIIDSQSIIFQNIYDSLSNNQRKILRLIASNTSEIYSTKARKEFNLPAVSSITTSINGLNKKDLLDKQNDKFVVSNPVFKEWLLRLR